MIKTRIDELEILVELNEQFTMTEDSYGSFKVALEELITKYRISKEINKK